MRRKFEWDENKRMINLKRYGIDFIDAIEIFNDSDRIEAESSFQKEKRSLILGLVNDIILLVVYTQRGKKKRIISARKASKAERKFYYEAK